MEWKMYCRVRLESYWSRRDESRDLVRISALYCDLIEKSPSPPNLLTSASWIFEGNANHILWGSDFDWISYTRSKNRTSFIEADVVILPGSNGMGGSKEMVATESNKKMLLLNNSVARCWWFLMRDEKKVDIVEQTHHFLHFEYYIRTWPWKLSDVSMFSYIKSTKYNDTVDALFCIYW